MPPTRAHRQTARPIDAKTAPPVISGLPLEKTR